VSVLLRTSEEIVCATNDRHLLNRAHKTRHQEQGKIRQNRRVHPNGFEISVKLLAIISIWCTLKFLPD